MKLIELIALLETLNIPIAYHHFKSPQTPPFLIYIDVDSESFIADDTVYHEVVNVDIELYSVERDRALESRIKGLLNSAEIPYGFSVIFIEATKQYKSTYEVIVNG